MDAAQALEKRLEWIRIAKNLSTSQRYKSSLEFSLYSRILLSGDTFFMNRRFCDLVNVARQTIPDELVFEQEWMVTPSGFMWLEDPFEVPDMDVPSEKEIKMRVSAVGWQKVAAHQVSIDNNRPFKEGAYQFACYLDHHLLSSSSPAGFGTHSYFVLSPGDSVIGRIRSCEDIQGTHKYKKERSSDMMHEVRWVCAAMHLMSQKLTLQKDRPSQRSQRRRMEREKSQLVPLVKEITLRRFEQYTPSGVSHTVDWQWQWLVSGHWRNQYYPSTGEYKLIWVEDYVKGPEDKPLKPSQSKIYKVVR